MCPALYYELRLQLVRNSMQYVQYFLKGLLYMLHTLKYPQTGFFFFCLFVVVSACRS